MGKNHIVISKLKTISKKETAYYASEMMSHPFSEEEGWGFADVLRVDDSISATLQKRISTYYSVWNEELQQVERQCFKIVTEVPFEIDFKHCTLIAEGTNIQQNRVKQAFRQLFWNEFVYEELNLAPVDYVMIFKKSGKLTTIDELSINDFQYGDCLIGRYNAKPTSQFGIMEKLGEHAKCIVRAKLRISLADEECILSVSNRNVLTLESSDDAKLELVDYLKAYLC